MKQKLNKFIADGCAPAKFGNLKKQAKLLLKQHREGDFPVFQRIRLALSRFSGRTDLEISVVSFALHDAQEVIAKEHGCDSWAMLKRNLPNMKLSTDKSVSTETPKLHNAYPMVFVTDISKAVAYYKSKLGFKVDFLYGEPSFYGQTTRDGASLHLRHVDKQPLDRSEEDLLTTVISVEGVKSLYLEFKANGVEFHQTLKLQPWGLSDFIVKDPDGNLLNFASLAKLP